MYYIKSWCIYCCLQKDQWYNINIFIQQKMPSIPWLGWNISSHFINPCNVKQKVKSANPFNIPCSGRSFRQVVRFGSWKLSVLVHSLKLITWTPSPRINVWNVHRNVLETARRRKICSGCRLKVNYSFLKNFILSTLSESL